jgi:Potassium-transporting ATPase A subunit
MASDLLQILIYFAIILACTPLLGGYMARVFAGERTLLSPVLIRLEQAIYGVYGIDPGRDQHRTRDPLAAAGGRRPPGATLCAILRLSAETQDADTLHGAFCGRSWPRYTGASDLAAGGAAASARPPDPEGVPLRCRGSARRLDHHFPAHRAYGAPAAALAGEAGAIPTVPRLTGEDVS